MIAESSAALTPLTTWTQVRRHIRSILAARFGSPDDLLPEESVEASAVGAVDDVGSQAVLPAKQEATTQAVQKLIAGFPKLPQEVLEWYGDNVVEDPIIEHMAFTKLTQMLRKQTRGPLFATLTKARLAASEVRALCVTLWIRHALPSSLHRTPHSRWLGADVGPCVDQSSSLESVAAHVVLLFASGLDVAHNPPAASSVTTSRRALLESSVFSEPCPKRQLSRRAAVPAEEHLEPDGQAKVITGEDLAERVMQVSVELTLHVLPTAYSSLARAVLEWSESLSPGEQAAEQGELGTVLGNVFPILAPLREVWRNVRCLKSFQQIRPQYVGAATKAAAGTRVGRSPSLRVPVPLAGSYRQAHTLVPFHALSPQAGVRVGGSLTGSGAAGGRGVAAVAPVGPAGQRPDRCSTSGCWSSWPSRRSRGARSWRLSAPAR